MEPEHLMCKAKYRELPEHLLKDNYSQSLDFFVKFAVPSEEIAFGHTKTLNYTAPKGNDVLRL